MSNKAVITIDQEDLLDADHANVMRLAKFLKMKVDNNCSHETLALRVFWEINPPVHNAKMY